MALNSTPAIACIGIIGQHDNPLHISLFPPHEDELLDMSYLLTSTLDIFDIRLRAKPLELDLGLLHAVDERLAAYGFQTNTGIKFVIIVDMMGRPATQAGATGIEGAKGSAGPKPIQPVIGLRDAEVKPAFRAMQTAYIQLLLNPFYTPEDQSPMALANLTGQQAEITSKKFVLEMERIGKMWYPGVQAI